MDLDGLGAAYGRHALFPRHYRGMGVDPSSGGKHAHRGNDPDVVVGRCIVKEGELSTLDRDDDRDDFREGTAPSGVVVPFAVDITHRRVGFQLFPGEVRPRTFTGALQSLLNEQGTYTWKLLPLSSPRSFNRWAEDIDRITQFSFLLTLPNPNWEGREDVEGIVTQLEVEVLRLRGRAKTDGQINTNSDIFRQALDHIQRGYGSGIVTGLDQTGDDSEWHSAEGGTVPVRKTIEMPEDRAIEPGDMVPSLENLIPTELTAIDATDGDEEDS